LITRAFAKIWIPPALSGWPLVLAVPVRVAPNARSADARAG